MNSLHPTIAQALRPFAPKPFSLSYEELHSAMVTLAASIKNGDNALSHQCRVVVVDLIDEIQGQIEQDQIDQQAEALGYEMRTA